MMSKQLAQILQAMTAIHKKFNDQAKEKQAVIKEGDMAQLEQLMKDETVLIQQLRKLEATRQHTVEQWMADKGLVKEDVTMETILQFFPEERTELEEWQEKLLHEIEQLKQQNDLNQQLLEESLRFVNMSLDSMQPQSHFQNYGRPDVKTEEGPAPERSLFDSKA
ncbi:flagellar protein FlgN [Bacillus shivajii]|uniref:flagellar protein FlgN n=1 Tax=Bacillus shivajii TaxID=1983719 RepID=UPI001CFBC12C|nr:flagellar protein FlgN [Bacillus shivajii]UCZ52696.1 flagellar protein FlgN [Bacillus shivajii]